MTALTWKRAVNKFVDETCDIIKGHYHCCIVKNGQIYLGYLQPHGYIDYAFPLLPDDPHANWSLAVRMAADTTTMLTHQQPQASALTTHSVPQTQAKGPPVPQPVTQLETTILDFVIEEEEIIEIENDDGDKQDQVAGDEESVIPSMT